MQFKYGGVSVLTKDNEPQTIKGISGKVIILQHAPPALHGGILIQSNIAYIDCCSSVGDIDQSLEDFLPRAVEGLGAKVLHASSVLNVDNDLFIFVGQSGAGKSTLAKLTTLLGARLVSDDAVVFWEKEGGYRISPTANYIKLYKSVQNATDGSTYNNHLGNTSILENGSEKVRVEIGNSVTEDLSLEERNLHLVFITRDNSSKGFNYSRLETLKNEYSKLLFESLIRLDASYDLQKDLAFVSWLVGKSKIYSVTMPSDYIPSQSDLEELVSR